MAFSPAELAKEARNEVLTHWRGAGPELGCHVYASPVTQFFCFLPYEQQLSLPTQPSASLLRLAHPGSLDTQSLYTGLSFILMVMSHLVSLGLLIKCFCLVWQTKGTQCVRNTFHFNVNRRPLLSSFSLTLTAPLAGIRFLFLKT